MLPFSVKWKNGEDSSESLDGSKKIALWALKNERIDYVIIETKNTGVQRLVTLKNGKLEIKKVTGLPRSAW